ncbi:MAG: HAD hydrolase-like protein [Candidatus Omnitrophica bacterium]|nr:HAD hydrolase-like protein [Candidatus Omnitrophota bacterium]MBU2251074.1 HAD hydrolase-like protein [Candidatus Omnitrophota bacterium]MBU2266407.1 HAD hydrolase-like protein [Candidatus Omnitrophota bacterium]
MRFKTIILDFDGTIVESVGIKDSAFKELFKDYSQNLDEIMHYHLSHNATIRYEKFKYITENILGRSYDMAVAQTLSEKFSSYVLSAIKKCPYVDGAKDFLDYYYKKVSLYLASITPSQELDEVINFRGIRNYFKKIYAYPWTKIKVIKDVIDTECILKDEILFIGDTFEDYLAAQEAGVPFVGRDSNKSFRDANIPVHKDFIGIKNHITEEERKNRQNK